jgi:uncharacterized protein YdbL (DUF1318 family)
LTVLALAACVTITGYFPAAAAEKAADRIIDEVWGSDARPASPKPTSPEPTSRAPAEDWVAAALARALAWMVPAAHAQSADLDISSPAIDRLQASMRARHSSLAPLYDQGVVGLTADGLVAVRDPKAVPLASRQAVNVLVADENRDRNTLYGEIARANGHPEWEPEIRSTFARRWVDRAQPGWWHSLGGSWQQK